MGRTTTSKVVRSGRSAATSPNRRNDKDGLPRERLELEASRNVFPLLIASINGQIWETKNESQQIQASQPIADPRPRKKDQIGESTSAFPSRKLNEMRTVICASRIPETKSALPSIQRSPLFPTTSGYSFTTSRTSISCSSLFLTYAVTYLFPWLQSQLAMADKILVLPNFRCQQSRSERRSFNRHYRRDRYQRRHWGLGPHSIW